MESIPKTKKKDSQDYLNYFITRINKKIVTCSKNTMNLACSAMAAILDKNKELISKFAENGLPDDLPMLRAFI